MPSQIAKDILTEELHGQYHPEATEDFIVWALKFCAESSKEHGNTWGRIIANTIYQNIESEESESSKGN